MIRSRSMTIQIDRNTMMRTLPRTPRLATAVCWSGPTRPAASWSRLASTALAWATRSIWPRPIALRRACHSARITGRASRIDPCEAMNWPIEPTMAWAAPTMTTTRTVARPPYTSAVAKPRGRRGIAFTRRVTMGLKMNAKNQAMKNVRITSPK